MNISTNFQKGEYPKMMYANILGDLTEAEPGLHGFCPGCDGAVVAKCGEVNTWHWAHQSGIECDSFHENETKWHRDWKLKFPKAMREKWIERDGKLHRADILLPNKRVIEFQNSHLNISEVKEREEFYDEPIWILNGENFSKNFTTSPLKVDGAWSREDLAFRWANARGGYTKTQWLLIDINGGVFVTKEKKPDDVFLGSVSGNGWFLPYPEYLVYSILKKNSKENSNGTR